MEYRQLGSTGIRVSELCLGTMTFGREADEPTSRKLVDRFLEGPAPEQQVPAVCRETIINTSDEDIVVQFGGCAENESGVVEAITGGKIVGYGPTGAERLIEITGVIG